MLICYLYTQFYVYARPSDDSEPDPDVREEISLPPLAPINLF